ncbi:N-formylglutamate amidohydrolase [Sphingobacterium paludis]|uniref:N-formylglutamate amidohydrolase n=1 Tax=Sphingobacterium paludis TaxID=1476465 RepID=A0A4V3E0V8_9SPHI|nr:N-formylglutamate amidohydrolase [Sphingobacterium paludis]TDS07533.1 N-formylglutamate amidohydrolase [Sphingobacterium paludis]
MERPIAKRNRPFHARSTKWLETRAERKLHAVLANYLPALTLYILKAISYFMPKLFQYNIKKSDSPFWAFAIHDGHHIDPALLPYYQLEDTQQLREEDPYTGSMAELPVNQFIVRTSRFQLDINRKMDEAIYLTPALAWGLEVWREQPPATLLATLQEDHSSMYRQIDAWIEDTIAQHGYFIVFDLHSYNARRMNPEEVVDTAANPQINLGTHYNQERWRPMIDRVLKSVNNQQIIDQAIDIRENVKFKGGNLAQHILGKFGDKGCVLSIEFRKDFMDEWTGVPFMPVIQAYKQLLLHVLKDLQNMPGYGSTR